MNSFDLDRVGIYFAMLIKLYSYTVYEEILALD